MQDIQTLLSQISKIAIIEKQKQAEKTTRGENFNVFNVLGLWSNEVRLHSAFISELLNPNGSHGMGSTFLENFLGIVGLVKDYINPSKVNSNIKERDIGTKTEMNGGRIDIIIEDGHHAIIIENKIYVGDQENQLIRYNNYGKHFGKGNYKLLYLTLFGTEASSYSTGENNSDIEYQCLSYEKDIINWLFICVKSAYNKPLVRETIIQYINLLKQLTGNNMDNQTKAELLSIMLKKDNIDSIFSMIDIQGDFLKGIRDNFVNNIIVYAKDNFDLTSKIDPNLIDYWGNNQYIHLFISTDKRFEFRIGFEDTTKANGGVFYGIFDKRKDQQLPKEINVYILNKENENKEYPFGWAYFRGPQGNGNYWWDWNNIQSIKDMNNGLYFNYVKEIFEDRLSKI